MFSNLNQRRLPASLALLGALLVVFGLPSQPAARAAYAGGSTVYLPLVIQPSPLLQSSIWAGSPPPAEHVALFRGAFTVTAPIEAAELHIFADTRYEVWVDGEWLGRGPARFSRLTREYDALPRSGLAPGRHTLAVLAQWAPNTRRSESVQPRLQAMLRGRSGDVWQALAVSGPDWKAVVSTAWHTASAPVHAWGLIGPNEVLDLRHLPADWMQPGFDDSAWPAAAPVRADGAVYAPRSIPLLQQAPVTLTVVETGALSPGRQWVTLQPGATHPLSLPQAERLVVEGLLDPYSLTPPAAQLDGVSLVWSAAGSARPDVVYAEAPVSAGDHWLENTGGGLQLFSLGPSGETQAAPASPLQAGPRLLLAEPAPGQAVVDSYGPNLNLVFSGPPAYVVLDAGRVRLGRLSMRATGPAGTLVDIGWDERLWPGSKRPLPHPGSRHPQWSQVDTWTLDGAPRHLSTLDARAGRYLIIAVWGPGPVVLESVQLFEERYPAAARGAFQSSNARLDRVWQIGVETVYANMNDAYADPWRERGQWWGDAFVVDRVNQAALGDTRLLRRGVGLMAGAVVAGRPAGLAPNGQGVMMLDYGMLWVQSLADDWRQMGDAAGLAPLYPAMRSFMLYLETYADPDTGLLDIPTVPWWQSVYIDPGSDPNRYGQAVAVNAMYYGTLGAAADLAQALGYSAQAQAWRSRADAVRANLNARLYLPGQRRYAASLYNGQLTAPTAHAQAWALAYGLPPEAETQAVADALLELTPPDPARRAVGMYGMYWVLAGLGRAGRAADALALIEAYYGPLLDAGATTWWENFDSAAFYAASLSHGWGASPTWFLTAYVLGARRTAPDAWELQPALQGVTRASGYLPLGEQTLWAVWQTQACQAFTLDWQSPAGMRGSVLVPVPPLTGTLTLNGAPVWRQGAPLTAGVTQTSDGVRLESGAGNHSLRGDTWCTP